ncbi:unnamed protein product [Pedinophyceae sp. YPF-701]|nr:unnamed protein product [Pedinophyceae sp. YPF-701]
MTKIPAFGDIGKQAKEVLQGGKEGVYQFDKKAAFLAKTDFGADVKLTSILKDDKHTVDIKASGSPMKALDVDTTLSLPAGKVASSLTYTGLPVAGLKLALASPVLASGALSLDPKLTVDYSRPYLTSKLALPLAATPTVDLTASTGLSADVFAGVSASYDVGKSSLKKLDVGVGYNAKKLSVGFLVSDKMGTAKALAAMPLLRDEVVAVEGTYGIRTGAIGYAIGWQHKVNGALYKAKIDHAGKASVLYEAEMRPQTKVSLAMEMNAFTAGQARMGLGLDVKN